MSSDHAPDFHAASSRGRPLSLADFEGKIPLALVFLGVLDPESPELTDLDRQQVEFGRRRVQLLVVVEADGKDVRAAPWSGLELPVLADPHRTIAERFGADGGASYVIVDAEGTIVDRGRFDGVEALLQAVDTHHAAAD